MCVEQLISTNRSIHCHIANSLYSSPHFEKLGLGLMALSTRTPINCAITGGFHTLKGLTLIHLNCNDSFYCENNINFIGDKRCHTLKPYILKTINEDIVPIVESVRPLNVSLPKVYRFTSDKTLVLTLEEQMKVQDKNIRETEKTGNSLSKQGDVDSTKSLVMTPCCRT